MFNNVLESESVRKLKELVHQRFQKNLLIQSLMPAEASLSSGDDSEEYKVVDGDLVIPIWVQNRFFATVRVPQVLELTDSEKLAINHLVKLILEPTFYGWYLGQLADNASAAKNYDNVRPMHVVVPKSDRHDSNQEFDFSDLVDSVTNTAEQPGFLFLEGKNSTSIMKVAAQIHDLTSNWAYLRFHEITDATTTADEIRNMGSISLLVEDVLNLSPEQRMLLLKLIRSSRSLEEQPFLMIGSTTPLIELEKEEVLPKDLLQLFRSQRVEIERLPNDNVKREEALEMLLGPAVLV